MIGEPLGGLQAGRFELVLKGLEQNVKYINTEYKKIVQMGSLMRFLVFPSSGQEEMPRKGLQYFSCSVSVIQFPNEYRFSGFPLSFPLPVLGEGGPGSRGTDAGRWGGGAPRALRFCLLYINDSVNHTGAMGEALDRVSGGQFQSWPWLLTSCVALGKSGWLDLSFLICPMRWTDLNEM